MSTKPPFDPSPNETIREFSHEMVTQIARQRDNETRRSLTRIFPGLWPFAAAITGPGFPADFEYDPENHLVITVSSERIKVPVTETEVARYQQIAEQLEADTGLPDYMEPVVGAERLMVLAADCEYDPTLPFDMCAAHGHRCPFWGQDG